MRAKDNIKHTSVIGFFWASKNFFSQSKIWPSDEMDANWLIYVPGVVNKVEYDFFMSSSRPEGNHLMDKTGDLWEGTFLFIVSVTGMIEDGSCNAVMMAGCIYLMLLFYELLFFFLPDPWWCPISTFLRSHIIICPLMVPAMTIVGSLGLNSKVRTSSGETKIKRGSIACISS